MKRAYPFIFILIFILLISCGERGSRKDAPLSVNNNLYIVDVDHAEAKDLLLYSSVFSRVKPIVLEQKDDALIGGIDKIIADDNGIFILDRNYAKSVFMFSQEGKFIRQLGFPGNGPGEYITPYDFTLDKKNNMICILDKEKQRMNKYNISTGKFIGHTDLDKGEGDSIHSYHIQYNGGVLFADAYFGMPSNESYLLRKIDTASGKQLDAFLNNRYNKGWENLYDIDDKVFYSVDGESSRFVQQFMDTVIYVSDNEIKPYLVLKSDNAMSAEDLQNIDRDQKDYRIQIFMKGKVHGIYNYIENGNLIYFKYFQGPNITSLVYDTRTNKTTLLKSIKDDLLFAEDASSYTAPTFGCATEKGVYYHTSPGLTADQVKLYAKNGIISPTVDNLEALKNAEESALVVFFYEYKD